VQPTERLLNLIAFLLEAQRPATADDIRTLVAGYDPNQSHPAFQRMFERDKDDLRELGISLVVEENDAGEAGYRIDRASYYLPPVDVEFDEAMALRLATTALASDPGYPLGEEIRSALAKLACDCDPPAATPSNLIVRLAPEAARDREAANLAALRRAADQRKRATFDYSPISSDKIAARNVEPYGLFSVNGHWYLVARCCDASAIRTYRLSRIRGNVSVREARPKDPDFEVPADFDLSAHMHEPWEIGEMSFEATVRFEAPAAAWAHRALTRAISVNELPGGGVDVVLGCADETRLLRWVLSFGLNATITQPASLRALARRHLSESVAAYEETDR